MKVGDYVRMSYGINKVVSIYRRSDGNMVFDTENGYQNYFHEIIRSSPNIMSLIEVGDLINKKEVVKIIHFEGDEFYRIELFGGKAIMNKKDIKSIVTKEKFESMEYKIGE